MPAGRPTEYSESKAAEICGKLSMGISLRTVCKDENMPSTTTVYNWFNKHPEFLAQYARAKEESADALVEEMLDIADDGTNDYMQTLDGNGEPTGAWSLNGEHVQRSKLRIDTRKWVASKLKAKKYGDKIQQEVSGPDGGEIKIITSDMTPEEASRIYQDNLAALTKKP